VRQELTAKPPDTDAAAILAAVLTDAAAALANRQSAFLEAAINQAAQARCVKPNLETPSPICPLWHHRHLL
jgi:hypothetical protein